MKAPLCRDAFALILTLATVALVDAEELDARRAPLCPSVLMFDEASWRLAPERVNRVAELLSHADDDAKWVQLVPTVHVELNQDLTVKRFGLRKRHDASWESSDNFDPVDHPERFRQRLTDQLRATIEQAVYRGLNVAIVPHIDAAGAVQEWRNHIDFDPLTVSQGVSYESALLEPIAEAIEIAVAADRRVDFALSGEMGRSWFAYPDSYATLIDRFRKRFSSPSHASKVRIGVASNWNGVAGQQTPEEVDQNAVRRLFALCDFVGFSCYAPVSVPPTADDFRSAVLNTRKELATYGADLSGAAVIMSEAGIGGGDRALRRMESGLAVKKVAAQPWKGIGSGHDPWQNEDLARLREQFHEALCEYLSGSTGLSRVERAFLWSEGPWDPQGVTETGQRNAAIAERIAEHNAP